MTISLQRFKALIDAYGSHSSRWPEDVRQDMTRLLDESSEAKDYLVQAVQLDGMLDSVTVPDFSAAKQAFLERYPKPPLLDRILSWCLPADLKHGWYKPATSAVLILAIGMSIGAVTEVDLSQDYSDNWEDEAYLLALMEEEQS